MGQITNPVFGRQVEDQTQTVSWSCTPIKKRTHSNLRCMLPSAAVIMTSLLALAPECVCILMHVAACAVIHLCACVLIHLLFGFKIKTTEHMNLNVGFQGLCKHACRHDYIGGFYLLRGLWWCAFMLPCSCS